MVHRWTSTATAALLAACLLVVGSACGQDRDLARTPASDPPPAAGSPAAAPAGSASPSAAPSESAPSARAAAARPRVVVLGDSLSAGLGLSPDQAFPALLQQKVDARGLNFEVVNAGVSGDTTAGGLRRLDWALDGNVEVLVLELGANDGLRGLSVEEMTRNLSRIIERAQSRGIDVLLCGMEAPPNFGASYTTAFRSAFRDVAEKHDVTLVPFLLDGVAGSADLNQADGIHPNVEGARRVAQTVWATLESMLVQQTSPS